MAVVKKSTHFSHGREVSTYVVDVDPASIAANAIGETAITVTGVKTTDEVLAVPMDTNGLGSSALVPMGARISAADTVQFVIGNNSAAAVDGASKKWLLVHYKG